MNNKKRIEKIKDYLNTIGAKPLHPIDIPEEKSPDKHIANKITSSDVIEEFDIKPDYNIPNSDIPEFKYFVDGVERTIPIASISLGIPIPLHITHLIAGIMERTNKMMKPYKKKDILVLILPYSAIIAKGYQIQKPQFEELDWRGDFYNKIWNKNNEIFFTDSSISFQFSPRGTLETELKPDDLVALGDVRSKALNRAKVLLRTMELGVLWDLFKSNNKKFKDWIILDGPIIRLTKYARLVSQELQGLEYLKDPSTTYPFLSKIIGAVKRVSVVPNTGLDKVLKSDHNNFHIPLYKLSQVIEEDDEIEEYILAAFVKLRPEIVEYHPTIWSLTSSLTRFDIPIPAILDEGDYRDYMIIKEKLKEIVKNKRNFLEALLTSLLTERWPLPSSLEQNRILTELYPIDETERWLKAHLRSSIELSQNI
jgi:hypothetical protein